jgi:hypothetical protein
LCPSSRDSTGTSFEVYWPTRALESYRQPYAEPLDLKQPDDLLLRQVSLATV